MAKHVQNDPFFAERTQVSGSWDVSFKIGLPMDVFHFNVFCQKHCNLALFPELMSDNGKGWWFSTSVAEQTNAWLGRFQSVCYEMEKEKYDFFLNEMIIMCNSLTWDKLKRKKYDPSYWQ